MSLRYTICFALFTALAAVACAAETEPDDDDGAKDDSDRGASDDGPSTSGEHDNVGACKAWLSTVKCGNIDPAMFVNCDQYASAACDVSPYFDCLSARTACNNGVLDTARWAECAQQASCM